MDNIEAITKHSDGLLVARGDLGIETDITNLPYVQRKWSEWLFNQARSVL